jgi:hypothetical protein
VVRNSGASAITGWRVNWTFANGQTITQLWNGNLTVTGAAISVTNVGFNGSLTPNSTASFGFNGTQTGTNAIPILSCTPV